MDNNTHNLTIIYKNKTVGTLAINETNDEMMLSYDDDWENNGFALSPTLPLDGNFKSVLVKRFIENLLPEGDGLDIVSRFLQISKNNVFGLIGAIGEETVGALSFLSPDENTAITKYRKIEVEELIKRIDERAYTPITIWDGKPRLSVAGVQEKLPIMYIDGEYGLGDGGLCSTHLLKFEKNNENLIINEYLSLKLAKISGLQVCDAYIKRLGKHYVLLVERFDREVKEVGEGDIAQRYRIERKHMIDSCQGLGLSSSYKYERPHGSGESVKNIRTGVNFKKLNELVSLCKIPAIDKLSLLNWLIVNLCLGNSDAHGKNISLFVDEKGIKLTPFYDIVNISLYDKVYDTTLAMAIGDEFDINKLLPFDFAELCDVLEIKPSLLLRLFHNISKKIVNALNESTVIDECMLIEPEFVKKYSKNVLERINRLSGVVKGSSESFTDYFK